MQFIQFMQHHVQHLVRVQCKVMTKLVNIWSCKLIKFEQCKLFVYLITITHPPNSNHYIMEGKALQFIATLVVVYLFHSFEFSSSPPAFKTV